MSTAEHRTPSMSIAEVIKYLEGKEGNLRRIARRFGLPGFSIKTSIKYVRDEVNVLRGLPPEISYLDGLRILEEQRRKSEEP